MGRIGLAVVLVVSLSLAPFAAGAQATKAPRVGLLGLGTAEPSPLFEAIRRGLREQGWIEGQAIAFEDRSRVDNYNSLPDVATDLVRLNVDVIVAYGTTATLAARKATRTIPIVTLAGSDPVQMGLVASLARPNGNVTGLTTSSRDLVGKRLELLKEIVPKLSRIAVLWNRESRTELGSLKDAEAAARSLGLHVQAVEVRRPEDLEKAFASMIQNHAEALALVPSILLRVHQARTVELAARHRLPSIAEYREYVLAGGMMSYGADLTVLYPRLVTYVDRILKGAKPTDLPVEQPTKFYLAINLKTAKALGLTIPQTLLQRADDVIQ